MKNGEYQKILDEYEQTTGQLAAGGTADIAALSKRQAELEPIVESIKNYESRAKELEDNKKLLGDADPAMREMAETDTARLKFEIANLKSAIEEALLPRDPLDANNAIMEIRAGAGGDESSLFASELYRMYARFAEGNAWKPHVISSSKSEAGGFKEIIFEISAFAKTSAGAKGAADKRGPYGTFKFESGVHRVQRVPQTEKSGRVHTSTVTIAVLPVVEERDFKISPADLKIEASTSRGAGGQSVNTTYSAIKITHLPTGITAQSQDERSQVQNRAKALQVITARVYAHEQEKKQRELTQKRRAQIGTGDRSEKIRTYNFPQDRVTDHRINQNFNQINLIMEGGLSDVVSALQKADLELKKQALAQNQK